MLFVNSHAGWSALLHLFETDIHVCHQQAPELIQGKRYDSGADIWSFGITALELTQGRPPHSRDSPHAVLLQT